MSDRPVVLDPDFAPAEEGPFLRPSRRTRARRARRGLVGRAILAVRLAGGLLVAAALLWNGYARVMASSRLKVARLDVRGNRFLSVGEVRELLGPAVGENILRLDISTLNARLAASPWVAGARVGRVLPDVLLVEVEERVPLALAEMDQLYLMDGAGVLIEAYGPRTASFDLPIVRGLRGLDPEARRDRAERAGVLLGDLGELAAEVSEVHALSSGELRVVLRGGEVVRLGGPPYRARFLTFLGMRRELVERCPRAEWFDLRFRDRVYVKEPPPPEPVADKAPPAPEKTLPPPPPATPALPADAGTGARPAQEVSPG